MNSNALVADTLRAQYDSTPLLTGNATKVLETGDPEHDFELHNGDRIRVPERRITDFFRRD